MSPPPPRRVLLIALVAACGRPGESAPTPERAPADAGVDRPAANVATPAPPVPDDRPPRAPDAAAAASAPVDARPAADAPPAAPPASPGRFDVLTQRYGNERLGWNASETTLAPAKLTADGFGKLFARTVDGQIYAQPLLVTALDLPGVGKRDVVFVTTMRNLVYAFDAVNAAAAMPFWTANLGMPVMASTVCGCRDVYPDVGSAATPAIDAAARTMFVTSKNFEGGSYSYRLHALDITSGKERPGSPVVIGATVAGSGADAMGGMVTFNPQRQFNRPGLLLQNGHVYVGFGSHGDSKPYHGWVFAYDATTLKQTGVFNTTPDGIQGAVWQSGMGLAGDGTNVYFATGNGTSAPAGDRPQLSESVVKLSSPAGGLELADWFMTANYQHLNGVDGDLGVSGPILLPFDELLLQGSKEGANYVIKRSAMGKLSAGNSAIVQDWTGKDPLLFKGFNCGGFIFHDAPAGPTVYVWPATSKLMSFRFNGDKVDTTTTIASAEESPPGWPGGMITGSSDGKTPGTAIVWAATAVRDNANQQRVPGRLRAFDAATLKKLWDSEDNRARDAGFTFASYTSPTVANGRVYLATFSGTLNVYGPLP